MAAERKAFVADGAEANWGVWRRHFSDYYRSSTSFHALTYAYAAAMTGRAVKEGWQAYRQWAQWLWSGQVGRVIAVLELRQQALGEPTQETSKTAPAAIVATSLGYLRNQRSRMTTRVPKARLADDEHVRGIDGQTDQPADEGNREILVPRHRADAHARRGPPQRTPTLRRFWRNRSHRLTGSRSYQSRAA